MRRALLPANGAPYPRGVPIHLPSRRVLPVLRQGRPLAREAFAAWDFLTASGDSPGVTLHRLEYFLWYLLPVKLSNGVEQPRRVAEGLADLLETLGYREAAALSRGPTTMHVLAEWNASAARGRRALDQALDASGLEPPDTAALAWSHLMGPKELEAVNSASVVLEEEISAHRLTPGMTGWRRAQAEILDRFLTTPSQAFGGRTPQESVWRERQDSWFHQPARPLRQALLRDVSKSIRRPPPVPANLRAPLEPLLCLLKIGASGPRLTQSGYLPPAVVRELTQKFGWHELGAPPRSEADVPQLVAVRDFAERARLLRRADGRLTRTTRARRVEADSTELWESVIGTLAGGDDFHSVFRELLLAQLLGGSRKSGLVDRNTFPVLVEAGWRPSHGRALTEEMVSYALWDTIRPMDLIGMIEVGKWPDSTVGLTEFGSVAARAILWRRSTAPNRQR